jgi:hypothetical protein
MKYLIIFVIALTSCFGGYAQFNSYTDLTNYINQNITPNGERAITGQKLNTALNGGFNFFYQNYFNKSTADARFAFKNHTHPFASVDGLTDTTTNLRTDIEYLKANMGGGGSDITGTNNQIIYKVTDGGAGDAALVYDPTTDVLSLGTNWTVSGTPSAGRHIMNIGQNNTWNAAVDASLVVGYNNSLKISRGAVIGANNTTTGSPAGDLEIGVAIGEANNIQWPYSFAIGLGNQPGHEGLALGTYNISSINLGNVGQNHMLGNYLNSKYENTVIIGVANNNTEVDALTTDPVVIIGTGVDNGTRKTGMIFTRDGAIFMPQYAAAANNDSLAAFDVNGKLIKKAASGVVAENPLTFQLPLTRSINAIGINTVNSGQPGVVTALMHDTWNAKQDALTGDLTAASNKVTITGGTDAVKNAVTVDVNEANLTLNNIGGTLSLAKGGFTPLTLTGNGLKYTRVNAAGTAYELATFPTYIASIVAGDDITIDNTDPLNPIISATPTASAVTSIFGRTGNVVAVSGDYTTTLVTEGTNLYFTDARARSALSVTGPLTYNSGTGVFGITASATGVDGYLTSADRATLFAKEPAIAASTNFTYYRGDKTFQTLNTTAVPEGTNQYYTNARARAAISLTTTGTSGVATYNSTTGVLNIPSYEGGGVQTITAGTNISVTGTSTNPIINALGTSGNAVNTTIAALDASTGSQTALPFFITDVFKQGLFVYAGTVANQSTDNGATRIVTADLKAYDRVYDGILRLTWFGGIPNSTAARAANKVAFDNMATAAGPDQLMIIDGGYGKWYFTGPLEMVSSSKKFNLEVQAEIDVSVNGFVMEGFNHYSNIRAEVYGPNYGSGAIDSAGFSVYTGTGLNFRNCDKCRADIKRIQGFYDGVKFFGSSSNPKGSQYNTLNYQQIRGNYIQIHITTEGTTGTDVGTTAQAGNWSNEHRIYGGQLGGGTSQAGGTFGIMMKKNANSNQGGASGTNPFNGTKFVNTGFEGLYRAVWAENADFNTFLDGRVESVDHAFYFRENVASGLEAQGNKLIGFATYENMFVPGGAGVRTTLTAGKMLTAPGGNTIGELSLGTGAVGRFLNIAGDDSPSAFSETTHDAISLGGFSNNNQNSRYAMHFKRILTSSTIDRYVVFEQPGISVTGTTYTIADSVDIAYVDPVTTTIVTLPTASSNKSRRVGVKNMRAYVSGETAAVTVSGTNVRPGDPLTIYGGTTVWYKSDGTQWIADAALPVSLLGGGGTGGGDITIGSFSTISNSNGLSLDGAGVLTQHAATRTTPGGVSSGDQTLGGTKRVENTGTVANAIELGVNGGNTDLEIARVGTTGNNYVSFQNAIATGSTQQWNLGTASGSNNFTLRNAQGGTFAFTVNQSNNNMVIGNISPGTDRLTVDGSLKVNGTTKLMKGTTSVVPLLFDPTSTTSVTVAQPGAMEFDGTNFLLSSYINSVPLKQIAITNTNNVDIAGDKDWLANNILPSKINGTAAQEDMVMMTTGNLNGAYWGTNEGGYKIYTATTAQAAGEVIATVPLPANKAMTVEVILIGKASSGATMWAQHTVRGYATTSTTSALKGNTTHFSYTSDFTPANVSIGASGTLSMTVNVSSVSTETVQWTAYVKVRPTFTIE